MYRNHVRAYRNTVFQRMVNGGREMLGGVDSFFRHHGRHIRDAAMYAAPILVRAGHPELAAASAAVGQASAGYADLRDAL